MFSKFKIPSINEICEIEIAKKRQEIINNPPNPLPIVQIDRIPPLKKKNLTLVPTSQLPSITIDPPFAESFFNPYYFFLGS